MKIKYNKEENLPNNVVLELYYNILNIKHKLSQEEQKYYNSFFPNLGLSQIGTNCGSCQRESLYKAKIIIERKYKDIITQDNNTQEVVENNIIVSNEEVIEETKEEDIKTKTKKKKKKED